MVKALDYQTLVIKAEMCGDTDPVCVINVLSGRLYEDCLLDIDPVTGAIFTYTEDGALWGYEYGTSWWAFDIVNPNWINGHNDGYL